MPHPVGGVEPVFVLQSSVFVLEFQEKLEQLEPLTVNVNDAACEGDDAGTASKATVNAAAASAHAAGRTSDRFIFDSQAECQSGGPCGRRKFRASNYNKNYTPCRGHPATENRFRSSDLRRRPAMTLTLYVVSSRRARGARRRNASHCDATRRHSRRNARHAHANQNSTCDPAGRPQKKAGPKPRPRFVITRGQLISVTYLWSKLPP